MIPHSSAVGSFITVIYQFYMMAFFFISGFVMKAEGKFFENLVKKFYQLMLPYYTINYAGVTLFFILNKIGVLSYISTTEYNVSFGHAIVLLLEVKQVYCDWLVRCGLGRFYFWG